LTNIDTEEEGEEEDSKLATEEEPSAEPSETVEMSETVKFLLERVKKIDKHREEEEKKSAVKLKTIKELEEEQE